MSSARSLRTTLAVATVVLLLGAGAVVEVRHLTSLTSVGGDDIWWHLRTGSWILEHHEIPREATFTQAGGGAWIDPSWGFDVLVAVAYRWLGLAAVPALLIVLRVSLAAVTFALGAGWRGSVWPAILISACAQYVLGGVAASSACGSILLFGIVLLVLLYVRRTRRVQALYALPLLFLLWANLDLYFVLGVGVLLMFWFAWGLEELLLPTEPANPAPIFKRSVAPLALACAATLVTPYFVTPYRVFFARFTSEANAYLPDAHAMNFKRPEDYVLLLLTMSAFLALGRRRSRDAFLILTLAGCAVLSFHAQRDTWLVTLAASGVLGETLGGLAAVDAAEASLQQPVRTSFPNSARILVPACTAIVLVVSIAWLYRNPAALRRQTAMSYPIDASNAIRQRRLPGPIFNAYEWGGFLQWYLPEYPVSIDSRPGLYPDDDVIRYSKVMNADLPFTADPALAQARVIVLPRHSLMGDALSNVAGFEVAYRDEVAIVLIRGES